MNEQSHIRLSLLFVLILLAVLVLSSLPAFAESEVECPPTHEPPTLAPITVEQLEEILKEGGVELVFGPTEENSYLRIFLTQASTPLQINNVPFENGERGTVWGVFVLAQQQVDFGPLSEPRCVFAASRIPPGQPQKEKPSPPRFDQREKIPEIQEPDKITNMFGRPIPLGSGVFIDNTFCRAYRRSRSTYYALWRKGDVMKKSLLFGLCFLFLVAPMIGQTTEMEPCPPPFEGRRPTELKYVTVSIDQLMELLVKGKVLYNQEDLQLEFTAQSRDPNIFEGLPFEGALVDFIGVFSRVKRLEANGFSALDSPSCYFVSVAVPAGSIEKDEEKTLFPEASGTGEHS